QGYLGRPDLTAERFVPDPFAVTPGARLYRSGDLGRRLPDGEVESLGRLDQQVKVRGHRIELGEVEAALASHPDVRQAVVAARPLAAAGLQLVAYVVSARADDRFAAELQRHLRDRLPEPMVPSAWVPLATLPLTASGTVDRRALPEPGSARATAAEYVPPRTPLEERLVAATVETLGLGDGARVGVHDNFFDLGGHSLLATQLVALLADRWGIELSLRTLFEAADLADLAERITDSELLATDAGQLEALLADLDGLSLDGLRAELASGPPEE
ncbi:MAG TPA: phosphopantetheine-binding protein, partial [Thermoanaerobaculia bacterium]